ncbi:c-type cytochrome biogenesis protein CcmI [sulfur-oxidizing endosymbiont of Gigantopelta aegis]|uniref:c-type cytochrome biogenesis protein CcmI n=1 Tax=sulfur-oxidizing endosymbiont of Gigantopelta aegis TaxID=2794934 RepID=UPI0018DC9D7A|nr:c-type cytochrome biogenesis protein CcmI [sulfur-oxidizing endosymbiont of Gigantopelta aegis]
MWVLWLICAILVVIAILLLIQPLFKTYSADELVETQGQADQRKALNIKLYEEKKVQIELDFNNGLLSEEARIQAQNEIEHSLIDDAASSSSVELVQLSNASAKKLSIAMLIFIPVFSVVVYISIIPGNIEQIVLAQPLSNDAHAAQKQVPDISAMVASLEKKLEQDAGNAQGWNMLGRSYMVLKRYDDAVIAYEKSLVLVKKEDAVEIPELEINYVEALMQTGQKASYQKAQAILSATLKADPNNGDALWFMGFLDYENGQKATAAKRWTHLLTLLPDDSEQSRIVSSYLSHVTTELNGGVPVAKKAAIAKTQTASASQTQTVAKSGPAPGQQLTGSKDEQAFIAAMIARVEKRVKDNPQDLKGWQTLGKSYGVLNRLDDSADAYGKAVKLDPTNANLMMSYSDAVIKTKNSEQLNKARMLFAQLAENNPKNLDALFLSGSLARMAGDKEAAKQFWSALLPQLPAGSDAYKNVEANIKSL